MASKSVVMYRYLFDIFLILLLKMCQYKTKNFHKSNYERKVFLVFVSYYCDLDESLSIINSLLQSVHVDDFIIVSNNHKKSFDSTAKVIYGSNRLLDMSGYYEGYNYFVKGGRSSGGDVVIFANDSIYLKHSIWALAVSVGRLFSRFKPPVAFYSGIPSDILVPDGVHYNYFSTYFFIADFCTVAECIKSIGKFYLRERRRIAPIINSLPLSRWSPNIATPSIKNIAKLKRKCVTLEFIFSFYALEKGIYLPLPLFGLVRILRFFIKAKNYINKITNRRRNLF